MGRHLCANQDSATLNDCTTLRWKTLVQNDLSFAHFVKAAFYLIDGMIIINVVGSSQTRQQRRLCVPIPVWMPAILESFEPPGNEN